MKHELWVEIEDAYARAVELPLEKRTWFLNTTYGDRPDIRLEVESLLEHQAAAERLDQSSVVIAAAEMLMDDQPIGTVVAGKYLIRERLGTGGMADVYLADHLALKIPVALKRPKSELRSDPEFRRSFLEEAQRAVILNHGNVARIHDVVEADDDIFVVMEYIEGETLRIRLAAMPRPLAVDEFLPLAIQCASALAAAHEKRIVHLDVKPENIMLTPGGQIKICDFGVGRRLRSDVSAATTVLEASQHAWAGTPAYMAPEVILRHPFDERADLFSLGIVFYEMLTGTNPFSSDTIVATSAKIASHIPPPISTMRPDIDSKLERIVSQMLAKDPHQRYATAAELVKDLTAIGRSQLDSIATAKRHARIWLTSAAACILLGVLGLVGYRFARSGRIFGTAAPQWVLVADPTNTTGDAFFDSTLRDLLTTGLAQSRVVSVFPRSRILDALKRMQRSNQTRIDPETAREISLRESLRSFVTTDVVATTGGFQIVVRAVDPQTRNALAVVTDSLPGRDQIMASVDRIAGQLRRQLGEQPWQIQANTKPLQQVTTRSLEALEQFSRAMDLKERGEGRDWQLLLEQAVRTDPEFAMAHLELAIALNPTDRYRALESADRAYALRDRISDRESYYIAGIYHFIRFEYQQAAENLKALTTFYPSDIRGHRFLAQSYGVLGKYQEAVQSTRRALEIYPNNPSDLEQLGFYLAQNGELDRAMEVVEKAKTLFPDDSYLQTIVGHIWLLRGNLNEARNAHLALKRDLVYENLGRLNLTELKLYEGKLEEAVQELKSDFAAFVGKNYRYDFSRRSWLADALLLQGKKSEAIPFADAIANQPVSPVSLQLFRKAGLLYAEIGEKSKAQQVIRWLEQIRDEGRTNFNQAAVAQVRGQLALALGETDTARQYFDEAWALWPDVSTTLSVGQFYDTQSQWRRCAELYSNILTMKGELARWEFPPIWPLAQYRAARCFQRLGDYPQASRLYDAFVNLWGGSQDAQSLVLDARRGLLSLPFK
jgi:tetratricopeptide (TPR) repeat protein